MSQSNQKKPNHLLWAAGGALIGAWWVNSQVEESRKSCAERDDPDSVREVCEEIEEILDGWGPDSECESENDFVYDLANYLDENTEWEIEVTPATDEGQPDIVIGDLLALEMKINPNKSERDRCVGQCAGYSRQWVTWIILVGASADRAENLQELLDDKGLDRILVWNFC
jgi:hypothetical protein